MNSSFGALTVGVLMIGSTAIQVRETFIAVFVVRLTPAHQQRRGRTRERRWCMRC